MHYKIQCQIENYSSLQIFASQSIKSQETKCINLKLIFTDHLFYSLVKAANKKVHAFS